MFELIRHFWPREEGRLLFLNMRPSLLESSYVFEETSPEMPFRSRKITILHSKLRSISLTLL